MPCFAAEHDKVDRSLRVGKRYDQAVLLSPVSPDARFFALRGATGGDAERRDEKPGPGITPGPGFPRGSHGTEPGKLSRPAWITSSD